MRARLVTPPHTSRNGPAGPHLGSIVVSNKDVEVSGVLGHPKEASGSAFVAKEGRCVEPGRDGEYLILPVPAELRKDIGGPPVGQHPRHRIGSCLRVCLDRRRKDHRLVGHLEDWGA